MMLLFIFLAFLSFRSLLAYFSLSCCYLFISFTPNFFFRIMLCNSGRKIFFFLRILLLQMLWIFWLSYCFFRFLFSASFTFKHSANFIVRLFIFKTSITIFTHLLTLLKHIQIEIRKSFFYLHQKHSSKKNNFKNGRF